MPTFSGESHQRSIAGIAAHEKRHEANDGGRDQRDAHADEREHADPPPPGFQARLSRQTHVDQQHEQSPDRSGRSREQR